jgi:hypothetical protein
MLLRAVDVGRKSPRQNSLSPTLAFFPKAGQIPILEVQVLERAIRVSNERGPIVLITTTNILPTSTQQAQFGVR